MEYSSLCYTVGPCCLPVLYIAIYSSSVCFEKCIMFCIYHYSIMQNSFTALKKPCVPPVYPGVWYFFWGIIVVLQCCTTKRISHVYTYITFLATEYWAKLSMLYSRFLLVICFIHGSVDMSILISQFIQSSPSTPMSTCPFSTSASLLLPCKWALYHFSRLHI